MGPRTGMILLAALIAASLLCSAAAVFLRSRMPGPVPPVEAVSAMGVLQAVDVARGSVLLKHQAIAAFGMPDMTMSFSVRDPRLLAGRFPGEGVVFTLEKHDSEMVVVDLRPAPAPAQQPL